MIGQRVAGTVWQISWRHNVLASAPDKPAPVMGRSIIITADPTGGDVVDVGRLVVLGATPAPDAQFSVLEMTRIAEVDGLALLAATDARRFLPSAAEAKGSFVEIRSFANASIDRCIACIDDVRTWGIVASVRVPDAGGFAEIPVRLARGEYVVIGAAPDVQPLQRGEVA